MKHTVFIDGSVGTTGLRIKERIGQREDIELITLSEEKRKDSAARKEALNSCDIAFLCLPDDAAREAVSMVENDRTRIIDASTAHRILPEWAYGFPELSQGHYDRIANAKRVCVPGCHASGFVSLTAPLVAAGILDTEARLTCFSVTGYSGGGKGMIAQYESDERDVLLGAPRQYALGQTHKHIPEMTVRTGLVNAPIFCPTVSNFYSGMHVTVPVFGCDINGNMDDIKNVYKALYVGEVVKYADSIDEGGFASAAGLSEKDSMEITVCGNEDRILLMSRFDNLGKGASGAAVECMNIMLGLDKTTGLVL